MAFDFDSKEHQAYQKTPAMKAIASPAGLWIASDNQELAGWAEGKQLEGGKNFVVLTNKLNKDDEKIGIPGTIYREPRMLVIGRSPLLYGLDRKVVGVWRKDDGLDKAQYKFCRRYMVILLDQSNTPLHIAPLQLTAWGAFQVSFDQQLLKFKEECELVYAQALKRPHEAKTALWHSMWVFMPILKTEQKKSAKDPNLASNACTCLGFNRPTTNEWEALCIGKTDKAEEIATLHRSCIDWWKKGLNISEPNDGEHTIDEFDVPIDNSKNRDRMMMESERLMQVLGWGVADGIKYLQDNFGKKSRSQLSDEQLLQFVGALQSTPVYSEDDGYPPY